MRKKINWDVRLKNRYFWLAIIPAVILLIQTVASIFGAQIELSGVGDKLLDIVNALFVVLSLMGIVNDPTTATLNDSYLAMTYDEPKDDSKFKFYDVKTKGGES